MKELIDISTDLYTVKIMENGDPVFVFVLTTQEVDCMVSTVDGKVVSGDKNSIKRVNYLALVKKRDNADVGKVGHYWELKEIQRTGENKQLV